MTAVSTPGLANERAPSRRVFRIYGDSLSLPRSTDEVGLFQTYPELIRTELERDRGAAVHIYNRSRGGATVSQLFADYAEDCTYFGPVPAERLIIQCGIVDCAPRPVPLLARRAISLLPRPVKPRVIQFLHDHRAHLLRLGPTWRVTSPARFAGIMGRWLQEAAGSSPTVLVINVAPTTAAIESRSPGLQASIELYNRLIEEAVAVLARPEIRLVDVYAAIRSETGGPERYINPGDGHHLTVAGHALYSRLILERERGQHGQ